MSQCRDQEVKLGCFTPTEGKPVTVKHVTVFDEKGVNIAEYYADAEGVTIDPSTYLGGGVATLGECEKSAVECAESQEWTYGLDNVGTQFGDTATYLIKLSDGQTRTFEQTPTGSWTQQLTQWAANIQQVADDTGLGWFAEPRTVNNIVPTDISGGYGVNSNPTGLPGAPSEPVAVALIDQGMGARYVNIQICPGQPVPVSVERTASVLYTPAERTLTTTSAILGPKQRFFVCHDCGDAPVWYLEDGVTEADAGQIPNCWEPCGTLSALDAPPDRECEFFFTEGCDNNNQSDISQFTQSVTRRATICSGGNITLEYFEADPDDPSALLDYPLVGDFVDCATGEVIADPIAPCDDFDIETLFTVEPALDGQLRNREWHDTAPSLTSTIQSTTEAGAAFREAHDFTLVPDTDTLVNSLSANDTNNTALELDIQTIDGMIQVNQPIYIRYTAVSEGYHAIEMGLCGGELELKSEMGGHNYQTPAVFVPAGLHSIRMWNIDSAGTNSAGTFQYSYDGVNWVSDNTPPDITLSSVPVQEVCKLVKICKPSGTLMDFNTGEVLDAADYTACPTQCSAGSSTAAPSDKATVYVTQRTATCITNADETRSPKYLIDYSDGTTAMIDPVDGEDNWCECACDGE